MYGYHKSMNIPLISGQIALLHVKLETEDDFELYGGTTKAGFSITPERPESKNEWLVTIDEQEVAGKPLTRFDVYVRQISSGREWVVLSGKILVTPRSAGVDADKLAPIEYNVTIPVVENAVDLTGAAIVTGIPGPRGWSAYEIAVQNGFEGTEPEWLEYMRQQTATLAVEQVTPLMQRAENAADKSERESSAAKTEKETAAAHAKAAKESELAASGHATAAAGEVTKAAAEVTKSAAEVEKAKQERETAAGYANAAAKSAQSAMARQQAAEQARQDAQTAKSGAEQAAANADASKSAAQTAEGNAKASADAAAADKTAAEQAAQDAQAAQSTAEEQAAIATAAAEAAQAPESIAAQSARPATMLLVRDELMSILGEESLFDLDTDGQKIIVHTDRISDELSNAVADMLARFVPKFINVVQCNHNIEVSWRDVTVYLPPDIVNKYDHCTTVNEIEALNPDYKNDLTSDGGWGYALFNLRYGSKGGIQGWNAEGMFMNSPLRKFGLRILPKMETAVQFFAKSQLEELVLELPIATNVGAAWTDNIVGICTQCQELRRAELTIPKASIIRAAFYKCSNLESLILKETNATDLTNLCNGNKSLSRFWINSPNIVSATNAFSNCILNKDSALHVLQKLAPYTDGAEHPITMGMHTDHQADEELRAAIDAAAARGWTVSEQWNGTAIAATFALRPAPKPPVYAKIDTYTDAEGNEQTMFNWCHNVTSPDGREPEELGYMLFESLEAAREYFGLLDETLTETE